MKVYKNFNRNLSNQLKSGNIGVMPTDTIYGLMGSALSRDAVERIYEVKKRDPKKPLIVLISSRDDLKKFKIKTTQRLEDVLDDIWPGSVSVILSCKDFEYIHRGKDSIAFRVPDDKGLINFLRKSGPLVAPSANISGKPPAKTVNEAKDYFGDSVDFYVDKGKQEGNPSVVIEVKRF